MKSRSPVVRPIALAFLLAVSFGVGIGYLALGVNEAWREFKREVFFITYSFSYQRRSLVFLSDGTPIVHDRKWLGRGPTLDAYTQMDGEEIASDDVIHLIVPQHLSSEPHSHQHPFSRHPFPELEALARPWLGFRVTSSSKSAELRDPQIPQLNWRWEPVAKKSKDQILAARRNGYGDPVSFISHKGFGRHAPEFDEGFITPRDARSDGDIVAFLSDDRLIAINLVEETVKTIASVDSHRDGWTIIPPNEEVGRRFVMRNSDVIKVFSDGGEKLFEFAALESEFGEPQLCAVANGHFIITQVRNRAEELLANGDSVSRSTIIATWLDEAGNVTRQLDSVNEYRREIAKSEFPIVDAIDRFTKKAGLGLMAPEPAVVCGALFVLAPWISSEMRPDVPRSEVLDEVLGMFPYGIPVSAIVGLVCAIASWRRLKRYQSEWTRTWIVFVFLFGLPGWLAWKVHQRWPPLDLVKVFDTGFVGPEPNGLEIR
ncbi:MAG: hypothetical protein ACKVHE_32080 [Planctomycetales bacterium]|jgi:hypothetical protein